MLIYYEAYLSEEDARAREEQLKNYEGGLPLKNSSNFFVKRPQFVKGKRCLFENIPACRQANRFHSLTGEELIFIFQSFE